MTNRNSFKTGSCELIILHILKNYGDCYAYQISQLITKVSDGEIFFPEGTLYPAFYKIIDKGYISDYKRKVGKRLVRVYYHLEEAGEQRLNELLDEFNSTVNSINRLLAYDFSSENKTDTPPL